MNNFIRNIKQHKIAALVSFGILALLIVAVVVVMKKGGGSDKPLSPLDSYEESVKNEENAYFEGSDYPVKITKTYDGKLRIELDGAKSPDSSWSMENDDAEKSVITAEQDGEEADNKICVDISPNSIGYATLTFTRGGEIKGYAYNAVTVVADIRVYEEDDKLKAELAEIKENTSNAGALDTDTPFLLDGNNVYFPAGGDWVILPINDGSIPAGFYNIYSGIDENNVEFMTIEKDISAVADLDPDKAFEILSNSRLVISSESLGISQELDMKMSDDMKWELSIHKQTELEKAEEAEKTDSSSQEDNESKADDKKQDTDSSDTDSSDTDSSDTDSSDTDDESSEESKPEENS